MASATPEHAPITYRLDVGEGWYRIRLDEHAEADVKTFLDVMFDGVPADAAEQTRTLITTQFTTQIAAARAKRGIELLIPAPKPHATVLPAAVVLVAEVVIPAPVVPDPVDVVARVARAAPNARTGMIAGSVAVRIDHSEADAGTEADAEAEAGDYTPPSRNRVEYVIAVPNDPRWLSIDLSVQAVDGFDTDQEIAKFDQTVAELTWSDYLGTNS